MKTFDEFRKHYCIEDDAQALQDYQKYKAELELFNKIEESKECEAERYKNLQFARTKKLPRM